MGKRYTVSKTAEKQKQATVEKVEIFDEKGYKVKIVVNPVKDLRCSVCHETCEIVQVFIRGKIYCYFDVPENFSFGVMASTDYLQQGDR